MLSKKRVKEEDVFEKRGRILLWGERDCAAGLERGLVDTALGCYCGGEHWSDLWRMLMGIKGFTFKMELSEARG